PRPGWAQPALTSAGHRADDARWLCRDALGSWATWVLRQGRMASASPRRCEGVRADRRVRPWSRSGAARATARARELFRARQWHSVRPGRGVLGDARWLATAGIPVPVPRPGQPAVGPVDSLGVVRVYRARAAGPGGDRAGVRPTP